MRLVSQHLYCCAATTAQVKISCLTFVHDFHFGHVPLEDPEARLVLPVEWHHHGVVVLGVVGLFHHDAAVLERSLLRIRKLESEKDFKKLPEMKCHDRTEGGGTTVSWASIDLGAAEVLHQ